MLNAGELLTGSQSIYCALALALDDADASRLEMERLGPSR